VSPEAPRGGGIGYIGINYIYSTDLSISSSIKNIKYKFNITDQCLDQFVQSNSNIRAEISQKWLTPGAKKLKANVLDMQGNLGKWSEVTNVDIYVPILVNNSQDLQNEINRSSNYTEISLVDEEYNVGEVLIKRKNHLALKSGRSSTLLTGSQDVTARMTLDNSTFINISGFCLNRTNYGLMIDNCSHCRIRNNNIEFKHNGAGVLIKLGGYNTLENNTIKNKNHYNCSMIIIDRSNYNLLKNNTFRLFSPNIRFSHIWVITPQLGNRIVRTNGMEELRIRMNGCIFTWGESANKFTEFSQSCSDTNITSAMDIIEDINQRELIYAS